MRLTVLLTSLLFTVSLGGIAQADKRTKTFNLENGIAIRGYDPVAYFTQQKAIRGDRNLAVKAEGVTYYFSSVANKELFKADFRKYEPQYGGWCAYAMGKSNEKVEIDPESFKIANGKLYLFYKSWINNTLFKWNKDEQNLRPRADANWSLMYQ